MKKFYNLGPGLTGVHTLFFCSIHRLEPPDLEDFINVLSKNKKTSTIFQL